MTVWDVYAQQLSIELIAIAAWLSSYDGRLSVALLGVVVNSCALFATIHKREFFLTMWFILAVTYTLWRTIAVIQGRL